MNTTITPHKFSGTVKIPASKSHTIRQLLISSLADGESFIKDPLDSLDTRSCIEACKVFGAQITEAYDDDKNLISLKIIGNNNFKILPVVNKIDVGNSGTTLYLALAVAALQSQAIEFTGDESIQKRSAAPLLDALAGLGVHVQSNSGCAPITIKGGWKSGRVSLSCPTSQYLSALLIAAPLAPAGTVTEIDVPLLNEKPYIEMTLSYLEKYLVQGTCGKGAKLCTRSVSSIESNEAWRTIKSMRDNMCECFSASNAPGDRHCDSHQFSYFKIPGGASWKTLNCSVPADFSSAAFPAAAAAITGGTVTLLGLDPNDTQGDKYFFEILQKMGCDVLWKDNNGEYTVTVSRNGVLNGGTFDLNKTPDLLPAAAAVAAFAQGDTSLVNVAHARIKETDRIAVMSKELAKIGVSCTELPDGLIIHGKGSISAPEKTVIEGHGDHRIVMAFAVAALGANLPIEITTAESAAVTYPGFLDLLA